MQFVTQWTQPTTRTHMTHRFKALDGAAAGEDDSQDSAAKALARREQLLMTWSHARLGMLAATAFALVLGITLRGEVAPAAVVDAWLAIKLGLLAVRALQAWSVGRTAQDADRIDGALLVGLLADGASWGAAGLYATLFAPWPQASFLVATLACISCVATFGLQISARHTASYALPMLVPTALGMFIRGESLSQLGGFGLLLLMGLQLATAVRSERRLLYGIGMRIKAEALAHDKEEALKVAVRQSAVKTQFLANMSHELRTPMHGILGITRLLHMDLRDSQQLRRVELIQSTGSHLLSLINDLLDIARIESGQFTIRHERFDLHAQVEQLASIYTLRAEDKGLEFALHHRLPNPCWVQGDPARLRQVLHNLLGNAIKFTRRGLISLTVTHNPSDGRLSAAVRDSGPGIPAQDQERIFMAFQQVSTGAKSSATEGVGLGLTIARDIARAMGGDITLVSSPGEGATLTCSACLPVADAQPSPKVSAEPPPNTRRHCLVLLAEDNDINALVTSNFLEIIGTDTERVKDGRGAVAHALRETNRPDIVLMDCQMPEMDGYEATQAIREQERRLGLPRIPIVALTATAQDDQHQACEDAGMDDFLSKPCSPEDLSRVILRWCAETPPSQGVPTDAAPTQASAARG